MKIKEIELGSEYTLTSNTNSRVGTARLYFEEFNNKKVTVLNKLNNYSNKNIINIQGICLVGDSYQLVSFWCSPHDLKIIQ